MYLLNELDENDYIDWPLPAALMWPTLHDDCNAYDHRTYYFAVDGVEIVEAA